MVKIYLDPGHGGSDPGAVGNGLKEKDLTLKIARKIRDLLKNYENVSVRMSRDSDKFISLTARANDANKWGADYFVSIHINAGGGTGFESFIYNGTVSKATVANQNIVHPEIVKDTGFKDRGRKRANFAVLRQTKMPAILTENGFIDNAADAKKLKSDSFLDKIAQGHVDGLVKALGLKKKKSATKTTSNTKTSGKLYKVQVGAFADKKNAEKLAAELKKKGYSTYITQD